MDRMRTFSLLLGNIFFEIVKDIHRYLNIQLPHNTTTALMGENPQEKYIKVGWKDV